MLFRMGTAPKFAQRHAAIEGTSRHAAWTMGAFLVSAILSTLERTGAPHWLTSELGGTVRVARGVSLTPMIAGILANLFFLIWIYRVVSNAGALGAPLKWGPGVAVLANLVPVVSLVLPYFILKALHGASDPSALPDAPVFRARPAGTYRDGGRELLDAPPWDHPAPLIAWWILDGARTFAGIAAATHGPLLDWALACSQVAFSVLSVLVVRSINGRQSERCRRLEAADEAAAPAA
jgi:hypothetical protein